MNFDPAAIGSEIANRLLGREAWARDRLAAHAGQVFAVAVGPASASFTIASDGAFARAPQAGAAPDLHLTLSPFDVPAFLADPRQWNQYVVEDGDAALGGTLKELAQTLPWFVEQVFARVLGPIAGQRAADAGRHLLALPGYAAGRVGESIARYARDEAGMLAHGGELRTLREQAATLGRRVDALAARVDALAEHDPTSSVS